MPSGGGIARPGAAVMTGMYLQGAGIAAERNPIPLSIRYLTSPTGMTSRRPSTQTCALSTWRTWASTSAFSNGGEADRTRRRNSVTSVWCTPSRTSGALERPLNWTRTMPLIGRLTFRRTKLPYDGCQERRFALHQQVYAPGGRDRSFEHVTMRAFTPDLIPAPLTFLDFWRGPNRGYCITALSVADVQLHAVLSGFDEEEAVEMMKRLVPIAGDDRLVEWHDGASRQLRSEIDSLLGGQRKSASH